MDQNPRICIIGAGAIGGVTAGVLAREKYNISLVTKYQELASIISDKGIELSGNCGDFSIPVPSVPTAIDLKGVFDYVLIATKADALVDTARAILPFIDENSRVVSMQNGICEEMLAEVVGEDRCIGCVVGWGGTMHKPGKVEMTSDGEFILGNWNSKEDVQLIQLAEILNHITPTRISENILSDLYAKLIINSCITTLGAVCGQYLGEMLAKRRVRTFFIEIIKEAIQVADAMGLKVAPGAGGKLDYYKFLSPGILSNIKRHLTIRVIGFKYSKLKSSSLQSLERGKKTEVDNYNGYISTKGKEHGVKTPVNDQLTQMVREIEKGLRKISPDNFNEIRIF